MQPTNVDPGRAAVERGDEALRQAQEEFIEDPTVFVKSAALGSLVLIELAQRARQKSASAAIRGFAERVLGRQTAMRAELVRLASAQQLDVPGELVFQDEQMLAEGADLAGAAFDAFFLRQVIREYDKAVDLYTAARNMEPEELAAFARRQLQPLEQERSQALALQRSAP